MLSLKRRFVFLSVDFNTFLKFNFNDGVRLTIKKLVA